MSGPFQPYAHHGHARYPTYQAGDEHAGYRAGGEPSGFPMAGLSSAGGSDSGYTMFGTPDFNVFDWHPAYQSCQRYFLNHSQHDAPTQAVAALMNIRLPFQWVTNPVHSSNPSALPAGGAGLYGAPWSTPGPVNPLVPQQPPTFVSLVPYIRRLVVTGMDQEGIMNGFFGEDWKKGTGAFLELERRHYLFTAKSHNWAETKAHYDMTPHETVPFLRVLDKAQLEEIENAEKQWSNWLYMQDWMVGPRAPVIVAHDQGPGTVAADPAGGPVRET